MLSGDLAQQTRERELEIIEEIKQLMDDSLRLNGDVILNRLSVLSSYNPFSARHLAYDLEENNYSPEVIRRAKVLDVIDTPIMLLSSKEELLSAIQVLSPNKCTLYLITILNAIGRFSSYGLDIELIMEELLRYGRPLVSLKCSPVVIDIVGTLVCSAEYYLQEGLGALTLTQLVYEPYTSCLDFFMVLKSFSYRVITKCECEEESYLHLMDRLQEFCLSLHQEDESISFLIGSWVSKDLPKVQELLDLKQR